MQKTFGPYIVDDLVAQGSTGLVYRARHSELQRIAAIKQLSPEVRGVPGQVERLRAEAATLASLDHPNVVEVYDYVEDSDGAWIAEQWVDGASLQQLLDTHGTLTPEQALGVVRGAVMGLAHAHERGIVHRDVSTANILADDDGTSMLVDFGIAAPTGTGNAVGTPAFLSPEAAAGEPLTNQSDVYSAAAVLYLLLTGKPVFGGTVAQTIEGHLHSPAPALTGHGTELADLLARSLSKSPTERPADAAQFLTALEHGAAAQYGSSWLKGSSIAGMAGLASKGKSLVGIGSQAAAVGSTVSGISVGAIAAAVAAVVVAAAAVAGVTIAFTGGNDSKPSARQSAGPSPAPQDAPPTEAPAETAPETPATDIPAVPTAVAVGSINTPSRNNSSPSGGGNNQPGGGGGGGPPPTQTNEERITGVWTWMIEVLTGEFGASRVGSTAGGTFTLTATCETITVEQDSCSGEGTSSHQSGAITFQWADGVLEVGSFENPDFPYGVDPCPGGALVGMMNSSVFLTPSTLGDDPTVVSPSYEGTYQVGVECDGGQTEVGETRRFILYRGTGPPPPPGPTEADIIAFNEARLSGTWTLRETIVSSDANPSQVGQVITRTVTLQAQCSSVTSCEAVDNSDPNTFVGWESGQMFVDREVAITHPCAGGGTLQPTAELLPTSASDPRVVAASFSGDSEINVGEVGTCGPLALTETRHIEFFQGTALAIASSQLEMAIAQAEPTEPAEATEHPSSGAPGEQPIGDNQNGSSGNTGGGSDNAPSSAGSGAGPSEDSSSEEGTTPEHAGEGETGVNPAGGENTPPPPAPEPEPIPEPAAE